VSILAPVPRHLFALANEPGVVLRPLDLDDAPCRILRLHRCVGRFGELVRCKQATIGHTCTEVAQGHNTAYLWGEGFADAIEEIRESRIVRGFFDAGARCTNVTQLADIFLN